MTITRMGEYEFFSEREGWHLSMPIQGSGSWFDVWGDRATAVV